MQSIVLEGLSRPLEDRKIEEKSVQNDLKFEVLDGLTLGIIFLMVSVVFDGFQKTWIR